jgi:hypothetical protein
MAQKHITVSLDEEFIERLRDCSAATGYHISALAEAGLLAEIGKLQFQNGGPFPPRPRKKLERGGRTGCRRQPMTA